jgi:dGTPase
VRALINAQVTDLVEHTLQRLRQARIGSVADVRAFPGRLVGPGPQLCGQKAELEDFLRRRVYRHYRVQRMAVKGARIVQALCGEFCRTPNLLPDRYSRRICDGGPQRTVCDYVAGMTDRYAQDEYLRLFQPYTPV